MFDVKSDLGSWLEKVFIGHSGEIFLGLDRILAVAKNLDLPIINDQVRLKSKIIVVAGTNGKGSVCAMIERIYISAGYKTALYSSPHLLTFNERLRINGEILGDEEWVKSFEKIEVARSKKPDCKLTFFEVSTLAAMLLVEKLNPDIGIFEIGLGGRLDAVNLLDNDCSILTSIDLDHQSFLGNSRAEIGLEKAHVARSNKPFIISEKNIPIEVLDFIKNTKSKLSLVGKDFNFKKNGNQWTWLGKEKKRHGLPLPALRGSHQIINASAAITCIELLSSVFPVSQAAIRHGLASVELPARFQVLPGKPSIILDVAHNEAAAKMLSKNLDAIGFFPQTIAVVGMLNDKDAISIFKPLFKKIDIWIFVDLDEKKAGNRSRTSISLMNSIKVIDDSAKVYCFNQPINGFNKATELADKQDRIIIFGSFITISSIWNSAQNFLRSKN